MVDSPQGDYVLEDFGDGRRLERLGRWLIDRPAPQAEAPRRQKDWAADWVYEAPRTAAGHWRSPRSLSNGDWPIEVGGQTLLLRLANGGQVGIYPEHIACWRWLASVLTNAPPGTAMLNLFGATGGASLAAARHGAAVTHVDAQQGALSLARANLDGHGEPPVRIIREDVQRFVDRAVRRGQHYPLIVLDPPSFGRGPKGQTWRLDRQLPGLLESLATLLGPQPLGLWLSTHTPGWDDAALARLLRDTLPTADIHAFPLAVRSRDGRRLASGYAATARWP